MCSLPYDLLKLVVRTALLVSRSRFERVTIKSSILLYSCLFDNALFPTTLDRLPCANAANEMKRIALGKKILPYLVLQLSLS